MLSLCPFDISVSVGVGAFVIGLSQISSFFSKDFCDCHKSEHAGTKHFIRVNCKVQLRSNAVKTSPDKEQENIIQ